MSSMMQTAPLDTVMRTLADPTRRAVFERIAHAREISVVELTQGSGITPPVATSNSPTFGQSNSSRQDV
jgi:DNA-binding transcriptional ArsR family regulator